MRFRLWRSKAFWLGLPGLLFLLWGWWHSLTHESAIGVSGRHQLLVRHLAGEVILSRHPNMTAIPMRIHFGSHRRGTDAPRRSGALKLIAQDLPNFHAIFIPYPYIILAYLAVWGGVLGWRWRCHRTAAEI